MYLLAALLVTVIAVNGSALANVQERVIYISPGSALIAYGGDKVNPKLLPIKSFPKSPKALMVEPLTQVTRTLFDRQFTAYGDGDVVTSLDSIVNEGSGWWKAWAEVEGRSETDWTGTQPQYYSTKIRLDESWRFHGVNVSVSYPPGIGYSSSWDTVSWSGGDDSGTSWALSHTYSGIYGESSGPFAALWSVSSRSTVIG
jgi:hypothetical protein